MCDVGFGLDYSFEVFDTVLSVRRPQKSMFRVKRAAKTERGKAKATTEPPADVVAISVSIHKTKKTVNHNKQWRIIRERLQLI
jgi:hypothetical protein